MLMKQNVNNDVTKDSPIARKVSKVEISAGTFLSPLPPPPTGPDRVI